MISSRVVILLLLSAIAIADINKDYDNLLNGQIELSDSHIH